MLKRIAFVIGTVLAAFALLTVTAAPAQAAPAPAAAPSAYCITMAGALTCIGQVPPPYYLQAPVKRIPERQAQRAFVRAEAIRLIQQRIAARQAALDARR